MVFPNLPERFAGYGQALNWLLPGLALVVPLACTPALVDSFDLPKLFLLKVGLVAVAVFLATRATVDTGLLQTRAAQATLVFLGISALATIAAIEPRTALIGSYGDDFGLLSLAVMIGFFFLAASSVRTESALARVAAGLTIAACITSLYAGIQQLGFDPLGFPGLADDPRRAMGTLGYPNSLGELLAMSMPLTAWLAWRSHGIARDLSLWALVLELIALGLTQARTAWAVVLLEVLVAGPLVLCASRPRWRRLGRVLALAPLAIGLAACVALVVLPTAAVPADQLARGLLQGERGSPLGTRYYLWRSTLAMIGDRPVLGSGPDTYQLAYPAHRSGDLDALSNQVGRDDNPHNLLLGIASDTGLLGLAAYLAVQAIVVLVLLRGAFGAAGADTSARRGTAIALLLAATSYLILFLFGRNRVATDWLAWVIGGSAIGLFAARPIRLMRLPRAARLATPALAVVLVLEATTALAADFAYHQSEALRTQGSVAASVTWLRTATTVRGFEPYYQVELGLRLRDLAMATGDEAPLAEAVGRVQLASGLEAQRDPYAQGWLARTTLAWENAFDRRTETPLAYAQMTLSLDPQNPLTYALAADMAAARNLPALAREYLDGARVRVRSSDAQVRVQDLATRLGF